MSCSATSVSVVSLGATPVVQVLLGGLKSPLAHGSSSPCVSVLPPDKARLDFGHQPAKSLWLCLGLGYLLNPSFSADIAVPTANGPPILGILTHKFSIDSPREGKGHKYYSQ